MPLTTSFRDCMTFAAAIRALGGTVPGPLAGLLSSHSVLSAPADAQRPDDAIVDAALKGELDHEMLERLLPAAAALQAQQVYRGDLSRSCEHTLLGEWHRQLNKGGAADMILDSLRPSWDKHVEQVQVARGLFNPESSPEHVLASAEPAAIKAWQGLNGHLNVISKIAAVARQFGPRLGQFPQVTEYAGGETFRTNDSGIMCCDGDLVLESALFQRPDQGHRTSPFFSATLRLHSIASAQERYDRWAEAEFDNTHSGPRGGWIDEHGQMHEHPAPKNPYRREEGVA
jgi:hypothetical protein